MSAAPDQHLVLVPGVLCTRALFEPQIAALSGRVDVSVADATGFATLAEIAKAILAQAPERFALAGLSMGGCAAFEIVRQAPARVTRLALIDTSARQALPEQAAQHRQSIDVGRRDGVRAVMQALLPNLLHPHRLADVRLVETVLQMAEDVGFTAFERQQKALIARPDNRPFLAQIRCPTVIIVGTDDTLTPVKLSEEMHSGIAGSRLAVIPECGHMATLEQPEKVNRILADWLPA